MKFFVIFLFCCYFSSSTFSQTEIARVSKPGEYSGYTSPSYKKYRYESQYVPMKDGLNLAVDVFLPKGIKKGEKVPTILYQTRYVRSLRAKFPFFLLKHPILIVVPEKEIEFFTSYGYACVIVDVRGSGASEGIRTMEFSPQEVADGATIADWIVKQEWSDGNIGTTGVSYVGTTAELLLVNQHPAVKACIPRSNIFDLYGYVMFPGGVMQGPFVDVWGFTTKSLDNNYLGAFGKQAKRLIKGINPVKGEKKKLKEVLTAHKQNFDVYDGLKQVTYRDEVHPALKVSADAYSIHNYVEEIEKSGAAIYRIGGWYDGALAQSVLDGMVNTTNTKKALIGPWDHGPSDNASPFSSTKEVTFNIKLEMLRFFDYYLKGIQNGIDKESTLHYFVIGEEKWADTNEWLDIQRKGVTLYLGGKNTLAEKPVSIETKTDYTIDYTATSGNSSRWNSVTALFKNGPTDYNDRGEEDKKLLCYTSDPLDKEFTLTGSAIATLYMASDTTDFQVFVYLEDVAPDGSVTYITEGLLRSIHGKVDNSQALYASDGVMHSFHSSDKLLIEPAKPVELKIELLPIAYLLPAGHRIRLSIAGHDEGHFDIVPQRPEELFIFSGGQFVANIYLPGQ